MAQTAQAVILLSRGGYSRAPQEQINKVVASLHAARLDALVLGVMVEKGEPSLPSVIVNIPDEALYIAVEIL